MNFNMETIKQDYNRTKSGREFGKWAFSLATFGLGGLYLWGTTVIIREGQIGLRQTTNGKMVLLPPGRHSNFPWESYIDGIKSLSDDLIKLGPYKIVTVKTGTVAKTYAQGKLIILEEGQHLITQASHTVSGFISTQQETKKLKPVVAYTQNNVGLTLYADVCYRIENPAKATALIDNVDTSIGEIAEMYISQAVSHHNLADFAPATAGLNKSNNQGIGSLISELMDGIKERLSRLGIELINIGITSYKLNDETLAHELGQAAVVSSKTQSDLLSANTQAQVKQIAAEAEAGAIIKKARAEGEAFQLHGAAVLKIANDMINNPVAQHLYTSDQQIQLVANAKNANLFFQPFTENHNLLPLVTLPLNTN